MHMCGGYKSYRIGQGHLLPVFQCGVKAYTSIGVGYVEVTPWGCQLGLIRTQFFNLGVGGGRVKQGWSVTEKSWCLWLVGDKDGRRGGWKRQLYQR